MSKKAQAKIRVWMHWSLNPHWLDVEADPVTIPGWEQVGWMLHRTPGWIDDAVIPRCFSVSDPVSGAYISLAGSRPAAIREAVRNLAGKTMADLRQARAKATRLRRQEARR